DLDLDLHERDRLLLGRLRGLDDDLRRGFRAVVLPGGRHPARALRRRDPLLVAVDARRGELLGGERARGPARGLVADRLLALGIPAARAPVLGLDEIGQLALDVGAPRVDLLDLLEERDALGRLALGG